MNIYSYGGGEILNYIFQGVAMLTSGNNGTFVIKVAITIGGIVAFLMGAGRPTCSG